MTSTGEAGLALGCLAVIGIALVVAHVRHVLAKHRKEIEEPDL